MKFRRLRADEIDARVSTVSDKGCSLLLYKDARVDQNILDETVGAENWQRSHEIIGGNLYCTVSIWDDSKKMWISKQDVGTESYTEKEKGQASDSFKRACFNWGLGRELYSAPFIWINAGDVNLTNKNGKITTYDTFSVREIGYDERGNISRLTVVNNKKKSVVFRMGGYPPRAEMLDVIMRKYPEGSNNLQALLESLNVSTLTEASDDKIKAVYNKVSK